MKINTVCDSPRYLNLGCGRFFFTSSEWLNLDVSPSDPTVVQYQLLLGIPFGDDIFEAVYHSHMLEHIPREQVMPFLRECFRVLRPGGVIRIAVPDLEKILRVYLAELDNARAGVPGAEERLAWMQIELLDQLTRGYSGGLMKPAWCQANMPLETFIRSRIGHELDGIPRTPDAGPLRLPERPLGFTLPDLNFLQSGERHCWMYDSISLGMLLRQAGFVNVVVTDCRTRSLGGFQPDCLPDGTARKPDSCYLEGVKPESEQRGYGIALFSTADRGGAGYAAMRLQAGLRQMQKPSIAYVQSKISSQAHVYVLPPSRHDAVEINDQGGAFLALSEKNTQLQVRALAEWTERPHGCELFSTSEAVGRLADVPLLDKVPVLHFHWIARFLDVPANVDFLRGKKIVWTLHDMNPCTGGCHYTDGCEGYRRRCGNCPQLGSDKEYDLSRQTWKRKEYAYRHLDITVVAPSRWLLEEVRQSSLLGHFPIHCIPNGLPLDVFRPLPKEEMRKALGMPLHSKVLLFSADNVLNQRKGLVYLLEALQLLRAYPESKELFLLLLGRGGDQVQQLNFPMKILGNLNSQTALAAAYSAADAIVLPSLEDNLPNVLTESLACGTPAVAFNVGGISDILDHNYTGYLARPRDVADLAEGLLWALTPHPVRSRMCRARAMEKFSLEACAARYMSLYDSLMK